MADHLYPDAPVAIRADILNEQARVWRHIAGPGSWFSGVERIAIAQETRLARACPLCAERKDALSPSMVAGDHVHGGMLPSPLVEIVHRVTTDPARLSRSWYEARLAEGLTEGKYVEAVGVAIQTISLDTFAEGLGLPRRPLPESIPGAPSGYRPAAARMERAWVPLITPGEESGPEADIYSGMPGAYIQRALTLVPDEQRSWFDLVGAQYLTSAEMRNFDVEPRAITHAQIEFLAGRISALNQCLY